MLVKMSITGCCNIKMIYKITRRNDRQGIEMYGKFWGQSKGTE